MEVITMSNNKHNKSTRILNLKQITIEDGTITAPINTKVSDFLMPYYKHWEVGQKILLSAPMGSGKSYFIYNYLIKENSTKKVLILSNRSKLKQQYETYIVNSNNTNVELYTYQKLENLLKHNNTIEHFDYIVCDEAHYFITDSWNSTTDLSFRYVNNCKDSIVLFMSATGNEVFDLFKLADVETTNYYIQADYSRFEMYYYDANVNGLDMVQHLIANEVVDADNKIIYFSSNKDVAKELYELYKHMSSITVSTTDKKIESTADAFVDNKCNYTLTIATSCIDNGIDIFDATLKYIVCDLFDLTQVIQCLGRKRMTQNEVDNKTKVKVYIRNWRGKLVQCKWNEFNNKIKAIDDALNEVVKKNIIRGNSLPIGLYYDYTDNNKVKKNALYYNYLIYKRNDCERFLQNTKVLTDYHSTWKTDFIDGEEMTYEDFDYVEYDDCSTYIYELQSMLGIEEYRLLDIKAMNLEDSIELALSNMVGTEYIGKDGKTEIATAVGLKNKNSRLITSIQSINGYLEENNILYMITEKRKKRNGKLVTAYTVIEIDKLSEFTDEKM